MSVWDATIRSLQKSMASFGTNALEKIESASVSIRNKPQHRPRLNSFLSGDPGGLPLRLIEVRPASSPNPGLFSSLCTLLMKSVCMQKLEMGAVAASHFCAKSIALTVDRPEEMVERAVVLS